jgi:diguanylate cyclase (GGDEF)-like protein
MVAGETDGYVIEKRYRCADGSYMWVRVNATAVRGNDGVALYCIVQVEDITDRKKIEQRLSYEATHDALTGLPLRTLLLDHLELALAGGKRRDTRTAVLFIDLDRFKHVNDSLGHAAGDELLAAVAQRIRDAVRIVDTPGRFGGDEFVVVCPDLTDVQDVVAIAERIRQLLETPVEIRGVQVFVGASIGIAVADRDTDAAALLRQADTAAYRAKERGRNRYEIFDEELRATVAKRLDTETGLRHALEHGELHLLYQPIVAIDRGDVVGFEALVRWAHDGKVIGPADFLAVAEDTGLIVPLGRQVLGMACRQLAQWSDELGGENVPHMSVNLSARQLTQPELADDVEQILAATGVPTNRLVLEITETVLMQDTPQVISTINALRALGVRLAIDDFGTGYSSLSYLRRLPVGAVKIDRSFILELGADHEGSTIVASVIGLAHALGMDIIAEGVETIEHVAALLNLGCDLAQGYYFSRPVAADVAFGFLRTGVIPQHPAA